jgi:hypothetical protein
MPAAALNAPSHATEIRAALPELESASRWPEMTERAANALK